MQINISLKIMRQVGHLSEFMAELKVHVPVGTEGNLKQPQMVDFPNGYSIRECP